MKIAIPFDGASALGASPDVLILDAIDAVESALADAGHEPVRIAVNQDGRWIERVRRGKFGFAFNLCEGIDGVAALEPAVIGVLELLGVPYTGSSSWTTALCLHKNLVNGVLDRAALPVPRWKLVRRGEPVTSVGFPAICKPAAEDASIGIEQRSVVRSSRALATRVAAMHERWDEVLVQRYVDGREVNVGIVGDTVLPIAEIDFGAMPHGMWRIVSYRSKWATGSDEDVGAAPRCPADLSPALEQQLSSIALAAWRAVGGEGYGRADFRVDALGRPWLLEINANPDLSPGAGLTRMAAAAGLDYAMLVRRIHDLALAKNVERESGWWARTLRLSGVQ